ncbi:phosphomannose isomerase type II C-terminal cupin domain [Phormidium sp. FACHB-1136]|jgi:mannose-6-phosphate isomerase|uniref:phosphomannose isomerase type II C-terminal cupin domain n=1 Tax=Phormidium sp. FACHB-1136 TaxID=2692848 RepID=UPI001687040E|nr:phosphomannose isomerase type II C-terminal cupin domain [Phormidium sp. FACHB-1136]MBD2426653.1 phosphomannose isomerase type II C-terminal cupin domain [Phormidium sp. FACHB-1136]
MPKLEESIQAATLTLASSNGKEKDIAETGQRPWGSYTVLEEGRGYKIKRIEVKPGHRLSLQLHHHRSEHWIVVSGTAKVTCAEQEILLSTNQSTYVPPCTQHRLENVGVIPLVLIEVQNGEYLGEDDIVRFHDDYARAGEKAK